MGGGGGGSSCPPSGPWVTTSGAAPLGRWQRSMGSGCICVNKLNSWCDPRGVATVPAWPGPGHQGPRGPPVPRGHVWEPLSAGSPAHHGASRLLDINKPGPLGVCQNFSLLGKRWG